MKYSKFKLFCVGAAVALLACCTVAITGCKSTSVVTTTPQVFTNSTGTVTTNLVTTTNVTRTLDIVLTTNTINLIAPLAVSQAVTLAPQSRQYIADAATAINTFIGGSDYTPAALDVALSQIPSKELQNPQAIAAINSVVGLYESAYAQVVEQKLNQVNYLVPILRAISAGITQGLATTAAPPPPLPGASTQVNQ